MTVKGTNIKKTHVHGVAKQPPVPGASTAQVTVTQAPTYRKLTKKIKL